MNNNVKTATVVNSSFVSIKKFPSDTSQVVDYLKEGTEVQVLEKAGGYYKIRYGHTDIEGYISSNFLY